MRKTSNYVGIDISKSTFDVAILNEAGKYVHYKFKNDAEGFKAFGLKVHKAAHWCVMEASRPYYLKLAFYLADQHIPVSVINPLVIRRFSQMRLLRAKTDKKDAVMIAEYGKTQTPKVWNKEEDYVLELRQLQAYSEQLTKHKTSLLRQLESFKANPVLSKIVAKSAKNQLKVIEKQLDLMQKEMQEIIQTHHQQQYEQLQSIPGIGSKTAMELIVLSAGFTKFNNARQLSSYVGLAPRIFESGTSVKGRSRICKMGMSRVRAMLYVCSWTAKKCNQACKELYDRLIEKGKAKKLALIAVANKLLKQAFAIATNQKYYLQNNLNITCF